MNVMKRLVVKILLLVSIPIILVLGCRRRKSHIDPVMHFLQEMINRSDEPDIDQRLRLAISKWQNGVVDPEPILIRGIIGDTAIRGEEIMFLTLITFDEDVDLVGFVIEEEHMDSNGNSTMLMEKYPVLTHISDLGVVMWKGIPVLVRDKSQRKPDDQWQKYVSTPLQQLEEEYMRRTKKIYWSWRDTLPPVWVSVPEPNRVDVWIRVYDRAGHLSERVALVHEPRKAKWRGN